MLRLLAGRRRVRVTWAVLSADAIRADEARRSASRFLRRAARAQVIIQSFRDGYFPIQREAVKDWFSALAHTLTPDIIFTHHEGDAHQDHSLVGHLTRETFRRQLTLAYEIPKWDGDLRTPNVFVPLDARTRRRKVRTLLEAFPSQRRKAWFTAETFDGLMRLRGVESGARAGYAEGFHAARLLLEP